ncbi:MAG TPA: ferritin-like domain-containing protein [Acidimicrobiales bacterium]|nr:ferritin-like domain-containing protein [Acidimicrobiales bacterium]
MDQSLADDRGPTRRGLLARAAAAAPIVAVGTGMVPLSRFFPAAWADEPPTDYDLAGFAQSVELALVTLYDTAAAKAGAQASLVQSFGQHHQDHADLFGGFFGAAGANPPDKPNAKVVSQFSGQVGAGGAATLKALAQLEEIAAATWQWVLGEFDNSGGAKLFAAVLPVEAQHAVTLGLLTGGSTDTLVPVTQPDTDKLDPAQYPAPAASASGSGSSDTSS